MIFSTPVEERLKKVIKAYFQLYFLIPIHHWKLLLQLFQDWKLSQQKFCIEPTQRKTTQYLHLFVTFREGINMNTKNKNPIDIVEDLSFSQQRISSSLVFDSVENKHYFPSLNGSNNFSTADYKASNNTKIDYTINHVFKSVNIQKLKKIHHISELERTQLPTILALSVQTSILNLLVTFKLETIVTFLMWRVLLLRYMTVLNFFQLCMKLIKVRIMYQHTIKIL